MRNHRLILGGAVAAAVLGMYSTTFASRDAKIPGATTVGKETPATTGTGALPFNPLTKTSGTWIGPINNPGANPPTDPREGYWNDAPNWSSGSVPNGATDAATFADNGDLFGY